MAIVEVEKTIVSVKEIEAAIEKLPTMEVAALRKWIDDYHERLWDEQIVADLEAGKLDSLIAQVDEEHEAGFTKPL